jgi:hypothetical protein
MRLCRCRREARGFYYQRPGTRQKIWCCSMACLDIVYKGKGKMVDPTDNEIKAIQAASGPAGEYIESLGSSDMAKWSDEEWHTFLECVVTAYTDEIRRLAR